MRRQTTLLLSLATLSCSPSPSRSKDATADLPRLGLPAQGHLYHGAYVGTRDESEANVTDADIQSYETTVGNHRLAWVYVSDEWGNNRTFPKDQVAMIDARGSVPFIRLMLRTDLTQNHADPAWSNEKIAGHDFDDDLALWGDQARAYGKPLMVEWGTEANGKWFGWNGYWNGKSAASFVAAYRHIVEVIRARGATNITWVFHANAGSDPDEDWNKWTKYYPGSDVVDWVGVSIYGAGTPMETDVIGFRAKLDAFAVGMTEVAPDKPLIVAEFGSSDHNPEVKPADWAGQALTDLFGGRWPQVIGLSWWNETFSNVDHDHTKDTVMRVQDVPELAALFKTRFDANQDKLVERPLP